MKAYYQLDGGSWVLISSASSGSGTFTASGLSASSTIQLKVEGYTCTYSSDYGSIDDISITYPSAATYSWTGPNSYSSSDIDPTVSASATAAMIGDYTLLVTDINGCQASDIASVTSGPMLTTSASFSTFTSCSGSAGTAQSFTVSGSNLTNDIAVAPQSGYEISTTSDFYSNIAIGAISKSLTLAQSSGTVNSTTIYARLTSSASNGASGNISCTTTGGTTVNIATS